MPGTTGDIIWRRRDPKTVELYNVVQQPPPGREAPGGSLRADDSVPSYNPYQPVLGGGVEGGPGGGAGGGLHDPYAFDPNRKLSAAEKKEHKKRLKDFMKFWKSSDPMEFDPTDGIQELLDGGIMWHEEDGFGSYVDSHMSKKDRDAFVAAADAWGDRVGLWKDGQYNPDAPKTYWDEQKRRQEMNYGR